MSAETDEFDLLLEDESVEFDKVLSPDYSISTSAKNFVPDLMKYGKEMYDMYSNPLQTMKDFGNLGGGVVSKLIPGEQDIEKYADAAWKYYGDRFGSWDKYKRYVEKEPVHALSDISMVAAPFKGLPGAAGKAAGVVSMADPGALGVTAIGALNKRIQNAPHAGSEALLRSTVKFPPASIKDRTKRDDMYQTMQENNIIASPEGVDQLKSYEKAMFEEVQQRTTKLDNLYGEVPLTRIDESINELIKSRSSQGGDIPDMQRDVKAIQSVYDKWRESVPESGRMTPGNLVKLKRNLYKEENFSPTKSTSYNPREKARAAISRATKRIIEDLDPNMKDINSSWGKLLELKNPLMQAANRLENNNSAFRMQHVIGSVAGHAMGGPAGAALGLGASVLASPERLQKLAHALKRTGKNLDANYAAINKGGLLNNSKIWDKGVDLNRALMEMQPYFDE